MPTKIMMIRHAEKPTDYPPVLGVKPSGDNDKKSLSVRGWTRAGALAVLFAPTNGQFQNAALATPNVIYAAHSSNGIDSSRVEETVTPLLDKLGANVQRNFDFTKGQEKELMAVVLNQSGGVALVCWEHALLVLAAHQIPLSDNNRTPVPTGWDDAVFDRVWVFDRDAQGNGYVFAEVGQRVLGGDEVI